MGYAVEICSLHVIQQASRIFPVKRIMVLWMVVRYIHFWRENNGKSEYM